MSEQEHDPDDPRSRPIGRVLGAFFDWCERLPLVERLTAIQFLYVFLSVPMLALVVVEGFLMYDDIGPFWTTLLLVAMVGFAAWRVHKVISNDSLSWESAERLAAEPGMEGDLMVARLYVDVHMRFPRRDVIAADEFIDSLIDQGLTRDEMVERAEALPPGPRAVMRAIYAPPEEP